MPEGAFYVMPNVKQLLGGRQRLNRVLKLLLDEARVVVTPGSAFGMEGYVRFHTPTLSKQFRRACGELRKWQVRCAGPGS